MMPAQTREGQVSETRQFGLRAQPGGDMAVFLKVFELVRMHGLPSELPGTNFQDLRNSQLFILLQVAHDFSAYGDRARNSAMQTLGVVTGVEQIGLRKEGWEEWWTKEVALRGGENR